MSDEFEDPAEPIELPITDVLDLHSFAPVRRPEDADFGATSGEVVEGAVFFPMAGYISDPQLSTHNLQRACENIGGKFRFNNNHFPIQNFYIRKVVKDAGGTLTTETVSTAFTDHADAYAGKCPMK